MKTKTVTPNVLTSKMLIRAAALLERIETKRADLAEMEGEYNTIIGTPITATVASPSNVTRALSTGGKRTMSAETKAKIAAGQAKRWAKQKSGTPAIVTPVLPASSPTVVPVSVVKA